MPGKSDRFRSWIGANLTKVIITAVMVILIISHINDPNLAIDNTTVMLIMLAFFPWLSSIISSIKIPGIAEITYRDLNKIETDADRGGLLQTGDNTEDAAYMLRDKPDLVTENDPNLAIVWLGIEIEKRLKELAKSNNLDVSGDVNALLRNLRLNNVITPDERQVFSDLIILRNQAIHGANVDNQAVKWTTEVGPKILKALDEKILGHDSYENFE